jgi:hypothetical protein
MAEVTKKEIESLRAEVNQLKTDMELQKQSTESLAKFDEKIEPNVWFVAHLKAILSIMGGALLILCLTKGCEYHERFTKVEVRSSNNQELLVKLEQRHEKLLDAHNAIRSRVEILRERPGQWPPKNAEALIITGKIKRIYANAVTVLPDEIDEPAYKFVIYLDTEIRVDGNAAKLTDLQIGMDAEVLCMGGAATKIEARSVKGK